MQKWPADKVERRAVASLIPYARNSRTHSDEQVAQIAASIKEWGWTTPVLIDPDGMLIAGHGRVLAAQQLGIDEVPCMVADGWTEAQKKAYVIADNKLALNAGWDDDMLKVEMQELDDLDFNLELTGFELDDIEDMVGADIECVDLPALADGDREPFQQKTFTLHDEQAEIVDDAVLLARANPLSDTGINENSNGNALALICREWLEAKNA